MPPAVPPGGGACDTGVLLGATVKGVTRGPSGIGGPTGFVSPTSGCTGCGGPGTPLVFCLGTVPGTDGNGPVAGAVSSRGTVAVKGFNWPRSRYVPETSSL